MWKIDHFLQVVAAFIFCDMLQYFLGGWGWVVVGGIKELYILTPFAPLVAEKLHILVKYVKINIACTHQVLKN